MREELSSTKSYSTRTVHVRKVANVTCSSDIKTRVPPTCFSRGKSSGTDRAFHTCRRYLFLYSTTPILIFRPSLNKYRNFADWYAFSSQRREAERYASDRTGDAAQDRSQKTSPRLREKDRKDHETKFPSCKNIDSVLAKHRISSIRNTLRGRKASWKHPESWTFHEKCQRKEIQPLFGHRPRNP